MRKNIFKRKKYLREKLKKAVSLKLIFILLFQLCWPTTSMALTGGPSQPEVQSFEPIGTSDMVDVFSGDFSYNIPLFDMDGYPMNISYHSGVGMDQEASWVGLGWNINPGVINRNMRGLPDDFNGDQVVKEQNMKKNQTVGVSCGFSGELFGLDFASFNARLGIKYNNYTGVGMEKSFNVALSASNKYGGSGSVSLGITSSSDDGLSLQPSISLGQSVGKNNTSAKLGVSLGASFNSRGGLSQLTISPDISMNMNSATTKGNGSLSYSKGISGAKFNLMQSTYSPNLDFPMGNLSITASLKFGAEVYGFAGSLAPTAYYTEQGQIKKTISSPAYGYMNAHIGQYNEKAMMDFNREKDGSFTSSTYNLPLTNLTYDMYSVSGQGTGGSYRPFRSDIGHIFDISSYSTSDGYSASVELGAGGIFKLGTDITVNSAYSTSGDWLDSKIAENLSFQGTGGSPDYETYYFKEANERSINSDVDFISRYGGFEAVRPDLDGAVKFDTKATGKLKKAGGGLVGVSNTDYRKARDKRNQTITTLTNKEVNDGMGLFGASGISSQNSFMTPANINKVGHHIGQITSLNTDGKRYVYAIPAYNKEQQEMTFAVGEPVGGGSARAASNGLVTYVPGNDNSINNKMGLDNYYNNTKMPPFAHSYLLSAVLSSDYVDLTGDGPTDDDLGNYTLFEYEETQNYKWRTPFNLNKAKFSEGLYADVNDDKGSIVYGLKQLFYLKKITTKNHVADFYLFDRRDGKGVNSIDGGTGSASQRAVEKIVLKTKQNSKVIKTVHFQYDYSLCTQLPTNSAPGNTLPYETANQGGKLTLTKLFFTYQNSDKGAYNSYDFFYANNLSGPTPVGVSNPAYNINDYDRWGNFKKVPVISDQTCSTNKPPSDVFPYTNQNKNVVDVESAAWHLTKINLPSGGEINVTYESDDYAYVQNKQATQMYLYKDATANCPGLQVDISSYQIAPFTFKFKLPANAPPNVKVEDFFPDDKMVFFKFRMLLNYFENKSDYVPGYAEIDPATSNITGNNVTIGFKLVQLDEKNINPIQVSPFTRAAIQFGRLNTSRVIWDQPNASASIGEQVIKAMANSSFMQNIAQTIQGPNRYLFNQQRGKFADLSKSWIKLKNVTGFKYGGGTRVSKIIMKDNFDEMTGNVEAFSEYGQVYEYKKTENGKIISSGVAAYEPQIGGEENALKIPFFTETKRLLAPDDEHYVEAPFGECFYPSASVGYSFVKVSNYTPIPLGTTINQHGTGYVTNEFYTARDFPTISERTELEAIQHKSDPFSVATLLSIDVKDHMTASQGFYVELNDMHGKPRATKIYNNFNQEISSTEYYYKSAPYGNGSRRLINNCTVIKPNGGVSAGELGVFFDAVGDLREQTTEAETDGININIDVFVVLVPVAVVVPIPSFASDKTQFRSATVTKVVQRFGILEKTVTKKDGSSVTSKDLAYDSETGEVLLTQTANDFNDPVYSFRYPAYWYYGNMGAAYKNIGYSTSINVTNGQATLPAGLNLFREGDELELDDAGTFSKAWVTKSTGNNIQVRDNLGANIPNSTYKAKVIRSGARNMQTMDMANITTLVNPLGGVASNVFQKVVSAKAIEFSNRWNTNCDCINTLSSTNPYTNGTAGNYKPVRNYEYLTGRGQTNTQGNSNIRNDGLFTSYNPFYKNLGGKWVLNPYGWTFASEITDFNPYGQELENRDALGRYSAATFGFNQSLATSVGANTRYRELGYESFEDNGWNNCADRHFKFISTPWNVINNNITSAQSHTGKYSLFINQYQQNSGLPKTEMIKQLAKECDKVDDCTLQVVYNTSTSRYEILTGTAPYVIDVEKLSGTGNLVIQNGTTFTVNNVSGYKCRVTVIDAKGCVFNKLIVAPYTN